MTQYIVRRLLLSIPALLGIVFIVFAIARLLPGDPCLSALGERATEAICNAFNERFGLNEPIPVQFLLYLQQLAQGDLGDSIRYGRPVTEILIERLPTTIELAVYALLFASVMGVILGLISALRRNSKTDVTTMFVAILGVSIPIFVLALILQFLFAVALPSLTMEWLGVRVGLPPSGRLSPGMQFETIPQAFGLEGVTGLPRAVLDFMSGILTFNFLITLQWEQLIDAVRHLILPVIALGTISLAIIARITRSSLLEVLGLDYIRTARAKGVAERSVLRKHAFRNAMLPVVTIIGLQLGLLLAGAVLTETVFNLTGVGRTMYDSIVGRDYIVVQGFTLVIALVYLSVNLVVDISYAFLDPRIRLK
ncbi:MAG TPA: ABC transporter permease [Anaerolineae bacterium]|jgi:peptide/nickel transport system permease protein|nr:ABC transporter permease [Anaerolineae bacterium]